MVSSFSCSTIYLSLDGMVDGFDMDKLFKPAQTAPTTALSTTGSDTSVRAISTTMTNINSKNAACSADNDKEEIMDYNYMPKDICERCHLKNDLV